MDVYVPAGYPIRDNAWHELRISYADLDLDDWCGILGVHRFNDRMGQLIAQTFDAVTNNGWNRGEWDDGNPPEIINTTRVAANTNFTIDDLIDCAQNNTAFRNQLSGYDISTIRALTSRLESYSQWDVLGVDGTPMTDLFRPGRMAVIKLNGVDEVQKQMIAGIIVKKIFSRAEDAKELGELARVQGQEVAGQHTMKGWVLVDEAHNYCPKSTITASAKHLIRYAKEGRSLGLGLATTTQQPAALSTELTSQVNLLVCHGLSFTNDIQTANGKLLNLDVEKVTIKTEEFTGDTTEKNLT